MSYTHYLTFFRQRGSTTSYAHRAFDTTTEMLSTSLLEEEFEEQRRLTRELWGNDMPGATVNAFLINHTVTKVVA